MRGAPAPGCASFGRRPHFTGKVGGADPVLGEAYLEDFRAVAETIHASGARAVLQLSHAGAAADHLFALAASPMWNPQTKRRAHRAPVLGLPAIFHAYGRSAYLAVKEAGYDGVEIDGGGLSLPNTFFSGVINKRRDGWGRDRTRFGVELVERVRSYLGPRPSSPSGSPSWTSIRRGPPGTKSSPTPTRSKPRGSTAFPSPWGSAAAKSPCRAR